MRTILEALDYMFPRSCLICGKISDFKLNECYVCKKCLGTINPEPKDRRWFYCLSEPFTGDKYPKLPLFVPFSYQNAVIQMVYGLKFGGKKELGRLMGMMLANVINSEMITGDLVIPIPLSQKRLEERGYNQADIISSQLAQICSFPYVDDLLVRTRNTNKQAECRNNNERITNISGAFSLNPNWDINGLKIILVDDVVTTGNTMHEAASVLLDNGASDVLCCAFASNRAVKNSNDY